VMTVTPQDDAHEHEARRSTRVPARLRCWCEAENVTFYARVSNISEGGLFLRTSTPLPRGAQTRLRFDGVAAGSLETRAAVVWSREDERQGVPGMGMQFHALDDGSLDGLRKLISEQLGKK